MPPRPHSLPICPAATDSRHFYRAAVENADRGDLPAIPAELVSVAHSHGAENIRA
jgi:hypothetical protein